MQGGPWQAAGQWSGENRMQLVVGLLMIKKPKEYRMESKNNETRKMNPLSVAAGLLIGSVAGALTMLLLAPQSGKETRKQVQEKGLELRDRTAAVVKEKVAQVRSSTDKFSQEGRQKAIELK